MDPTLFQRPARVERSFDVAMVAAWDPLKRHEVLFRALRRIRETTGRRLRTALVGYPMSWDQARIRALARAHGLESECTFLELIPQVGGGRLQVVDLLLELLDPALHRRRALAADGRDGQ